MKVIAVNKTTLTCIQYDNVSNIAYSSGTYTITYGDPAQTITYTEDDVRIAILW